MARYVVRLDRRTTAEVETLLEASLAFTRFLDENLLGASQMQRGAGMVREAATGKAVAKISYNGRIWDCAGKELEG